MTETFCPVRLSRAEAFRLACERNALRRESQLPLIPMSKAVEEELRRDAIRAHYAAADHYGPVYDRITRGVIEALDEERGVSFHKSAGGRWIVNLRSDREFATFLASRGFPRPMPAMTRYGSVKAKEAALTGALDAVLD